MNTFTQNQLKYMVARATCEKIKKQINAKTVLGIGSGSTVNYFVDALSNAKLSFGGAIPASENTKNLLIKRGIKVLELNSIDTLPLYIDGADEVDDKFYLIKGGGGALAREKVLASASEEFLCLVDVNKKVHKLGIFPIAIEILPMAKTFVEKQIKLLGGYSSLRKDFITDNGNFILDTQNLNADDPSLLETKLNNIAGVVASGIFSSQRPEKIIMANANGSITESKRTKN